MADWQPIETAPQDGSTKIIAAAWNEAKTVSTISIVTLESLTSKNGEVGRPRAIFGMGAVFYPTHWMPLPAPPTTP